MKTTQGARAQGAGSRADDVRGERVRVDRARRFDRAAREARLGVVEPRALAVLLLDAERDRVAHDRAARDLRLGLLGGLGLREPV